MAMVAHYLRTETSHRQFIIGQPNNNVIRKLIPNYVIFIIIIDARIFNVTRKSIKTKEKMI